MSASPLLDIVHLKVPLLHFGTCGTCMMGYEPVEWKWSCQAGGEGGAWIKKHNQLMSVPGLLFKGSISRGGKGLSLQSMTSNTHTFLILQG